MRRFHESAHWRRNNFSGVEDRLPAQNGANDLSCQRAAHVRTVPVAIKQIFRAHDIRLVQIHQRQVRVRPTGDAAFRFGQFESFGHVERRQPRDALERRAPPRLFADCRLQFPRAEAVPEISGANAAIFPSATPMSATCPPS